MAWEKAGGAQGVCSEAHDLDEVGLPPPAGAAGGVLVARWGAQKSNSSLWEKHGVITGLLGPGGNEE